MGEPSQFKLIIEDDEGRRSVVPVELGEVSIGRLEGNTIRLKERNVSRRHARLVRENQAIFAEDLDSYNGLWVNGGRVSGRQELRDGDLLRIGDFQLELQGDNLHPRREDTTQRTMLAAQAEAKGVPPALHAEEPTLTAAKPLPSLEAAQVVPIVDPNGPPDAGELTAVIRGTAAVQDTDRRAPPLPPGARPKLVCVSAQFPRQEFEISRAETVLGRTEENDVALDHRSVSRQHAKIVVAAKRYKIVDLESANGTLVNGEAYAQTELKRGDLIELGHVKLRFVLPGETYVLTSDEAEAVSRRPTGAWAGRNPALLVAAAGLTAALLVIAAWLAFGGGGAKPDGETAKEAPQQPALEPPRGEGGEAEKLMAQVHGAMAQHQWKRGQALASAVLALDPSKEEAQTSLHQVELEMRAQHSYESAAAAVGASAWSDAWNALQEVPKESFYYPQAMSLMAQVRPALISERLGECRTAIKSEDWDEAELQLEEVEGLDAGRKEIAELRGVIEEGRRRRGLGARPAKTRSKSKDPTKASKPLVQTPPVRRPGDDAKGPFVLPQPPPQTPQVRRPADDAKGLYSEGVKALTGGQLARAIDELSRCVQADKSFALCYRALGIAYAKSNNGPKAARYYRLYLKADPAAQDGPQVRQLLQQYESAQ